MGNQLSLMHCSTIDPMRGMRLANEIIKISAHLFATIGPSGAVRSPCWSRGWRRQNGGEWRPQGSEPVWSARINMQRFARVAVRYRLRVAL